MLEPVVAAGEPQERSARLKLRHTFRSTTERKEIAMTRLIFAALTLAAAVLIQPRSGEAAPYWPWCSQYGLPSLAHSCAFSSWEQCMETVRGIGGYCYANPYPPPAPSARSAKPRRHAARSEGGPR